MPTLVLWLHSIASYMYICIYELSLQFGTRMNGIYSVDKRQRSMIQILFYSQNFQKTKYRILIMWEEQMNIEPKKMIDF